MGLEDIFGTVEHLQFCVGSKPTLVRFGGSVRLFLLCICVHCNSNMVAIKANIPSIHVS